MENDSDDLESSRENYNSNAVYTNNPEAIKFIVYRTKTKKWGTYLLYVGYFILFMNLLSLAITIAKMVGLIDETGADYEPDKDSILQEIDGKVESGQELSLDEKQALIEEQDIQERKRRFHSIILTR